jgi:hypothetical protein
VLACAAACGGPPADTPSAVILLTPETVCEGDANATSILLDGRMSSRHLSLVPLPPEDTSYPDGAMPVPLTFAWHLEGDAYQITNGSLTGSTVTVTVAGERPLHVSLTTTNLAGGTATSLRTLPITVPETWPRRCTMDAQCPGGACDVATNACVGTLHCATSANCPPCFVCDATPMTCVPRPS